MKTSAPVTPAPTALAGKPMRAPAADRVRGLAPLLAVLLFMAAVLAAFAYLHTGATQQQRHALQLDAERLQQRIHMRLLRQREQLSTLALDIARGSVSDEQFRDRARTLLNEHDELLGVGWIDTAGALRVAGLRPGQQHAWDLAHEVAPDEAAAPARSSRSLQPTYLPPPSIRGQEPLVELRVPVVRQQHAEGSVIALYGLDRLLGLTVPGALDRGHSVTLLHAARGVLSGPPPQGTGWLARLRNRATLITEVPVIPMSNGILLQLRASQTTPGFVRSATFWLALILFGLVSWLLMTTWRQSRQARETLLALREETAFRRAMENSMRTGMHVLDMQGHIIYVNPAFCAMTGWSRDEMVGQSEPFCYWPLRDNATQYRELVAELGQGRKTAGLQVRLQRKDGSAFDAGLYVSPLVDADGKQVGWMTSVTDITEPNRVREQLSGARERFKVVLESLGAAVSVAPIGSVELLFANRQYRQWFGDSTEGHLQLVLNGSTAGINPSDESLDSVDSFAGFPLESLPERAAPANTEVYMERLGKWLEVHSRYLHWADGRLVQMIIATDVTMRREATERAAAQAEQMEAINRLVTMGEMASSVAHELNQPLTAISNYCTGVIARLQRGRIEPEELLAVLEKTAHQAQRAGQVIQHIRSFVKRSAPRRQVVNTAALIDQVMELAQIDLRRRRIEFSCERAGDLPDLCADPILVEQVLMNLLKNGADAIDGHAQAERRLLQLQVSPQAGAAGPMVQFAVTDSGPGLSEEAKQRVYEPFFSTKSEGMGIGLSLCRSIVEAHQGRMAMENLYNQDERIVGCRFTVWLPASGAAADAEPQGSTRQSGIIVT